MPRSPAQQVLALLDEARMDEFDPVTAGFALGAGVMGANWFYDEAKRAIAGKVRRDYDIEHDLVNYRQARDRIGKSGKPPLQRQEDQERLEKQTIARLAAKIRAVRNKEARTKGKPTLHGGVAKKDIRSAKRSLYGTFGGHRAWHGQVD